MLVIMKLLSDQIRDLIREYSTSPNAIAKEAGIDSTSISRFMNGENITVRKLDQLAKVLGVTVTSELSSVPLPSEKGRPKKTKVQAIETKQSEYQRLADYYAREAHQNHIESRRGVWRIDANLVVYYNNNPYISFPKAREKENELIEKTLRKERIKTIAKGQFGDTIADSNELYTTVLLLKARGDNMEVVSKIVLEVTELSNEIMNEKIKKQLRHK
jgi:transcriptional regulator with XRE-family HTH domain